MTPEYSLLPASRPSNALSRQATWRPCRHRRAKSSSLSKLIQSLSVVISVLMTITAMAFLVILMAQHSRRGHSLIGADNVDFGVSSAATPTTATTATSSSTTWTKLVPTHCPYPNITVRRKSKLTAFLLSLFVGGLGIDRFYLSHIVTGLVKLCTLGGLGVWWIVDWMLIVTDVLVDISGCPLIMDM